MHYYIPNLVSKTSCIGNTLSTFNLSFAGLDTNLRNLSVYTVASVNFLSGAIQSVSATLYSHISSTSAFLQTEINFLSSTMISVSSNLQTQINYVSSNVISNYTAQQIIFQGADGSVDWNTDLGLNAKVVLTANGYLNNPTGESAGDTGNLVLLSDAASGYTLTGFGNLWTFSGNVSSQTAAPTAYNLISFYYDGVKNLSNIVNF